MHSSALLTKISGKPCSCAQAPLRQRVRRAPCTVIPRAEQKDNGKPTPSPKDNKEKSQPDRHVDRALQNLRSANPDVARQVLKAWKDAGVTDAKGVRAQFYKAGLSAVAIASIQVLFDAFASYCSFQTAGTISYADFPLHTFVAYLVYTLAIYFAIGVVLDLFTIGVTVTSTVVLGTKADSVLASVEELAGRSSSGLSVIDKAQQAVNTGKIVLALNSIATALKNGNDQAAPSLQTLDRLSALMTLKDAEEKYGFSPAKFGIDDTEALRMALAFSAYDTNSDCRLEYSEFKRFCDESTFDLTEAEVKAAMKLLDERGNGYVDYDEFAAWWVKSSEQRASDFKDTSPKKTPTQAAS